MKKKILTNTEVSELVDAMVERLRPHLMLEGKFTMDAHIYGIPRGGIPVAYMLAERIGWTVANSIDEADIIVDDIIDSGATMRRALAVVPEGRRVHFEALIRDDYRDPETWYVFPWEVGPDESDASALDIPLRFLQHIGEDVSREGLLDTPKRVVKMWSELYGGYNQDPAAILKAQFSNRRPGHISHGNESPMYDQMVVLRDIEFYSTCEHHTLPFFGRAYVGYIPGEKVVGVSKLARLVDCFARRLQIQERLTQQVAEAIQTHLRPAGVAVLIEAQHFCMTSRGVQKQNSVMVTSELLGVLRKPEARAEFLSLIGK